MLLLRRIKVSRILGNEKRKVYSVRIEPSVYEAILKRYDTLAKFIDVKVKKDKNIKVKVKG